MADSEKLTELKKAYAEIILNTVKEAAARIMTSERKAERYRRELVAAKDEAVRMLLRLKYLFESKENEAEKRSGIQSKKIELLEAQLGEAEDIVKDLRSDLRESQERLEYLMNHQHENVAKIREAHGGLPQQIVQNKLNNLPQMNLDSEITTERNSCFLKQESVEEESFFSGSKFPSILVAKKEPELYRNGCTHRVRASETNMFEKSQLFSDKDSHKTIPIVSKYDRELHDGNVKLSNPTCSEETANFEELR